MNPEEIDAFLSRKLLGALATLRADGSPTVVPVWYLWDGQAIKVWTDPAFGWVGRLRDEPRVAFSVFEHEMPQRAVYIRGTATVVEGSITELYDEIRAITVRYVGEARLEAEIAAYEGSGPKAVVTIAPTSLRGMVNS